MRKEYYSLSAFYRDFAGESAGYVSLEEIDALIARLVSEKNAEAIELPNGAVVVHIPNRMSAKYLPQKRHGKANYTKLSVSVRKEDAALFAGACRRLGATQSDIIMPLIRETVKRAGIRNERDA
jgi:hypothetical protein